MQCNGLLTNDNAIVQGIKVELNSLACGADSLRNTHFCVLRPGSCKHRTSHEPNPIQPIMLRRSSATDPIKFV